MLNPDMLRSRFDPVTGEIAGARAVRRHLSDLRGCFADSQAYEVALAAGNPLIYSVGAVEPADGEGDLHYGLGLLLPGRIGNEYYLTKGHLHAWRPAAEFYFGLTGEGVMLLEDEATGESRIVPLSPNGVVYVPGCTAHRTMNVGTTPLTYLGVYPAKAGHDYSAIAKNSFRCVVIERDGKPAMMKRKDLLK
ncbi:MAG: glucose-6-phosphate isomerase [Planctomycetes bacterium]|nr:glucose-6-phosphate isomerase [Planctomycetota bacterium]